MTLAPPMAITSSQPVASLTFERGEDPDEVEREWVKAWLPRILGIAPLAMLALGLVSQGGLSRGWEMVLTLVVLCAALLLLYNFISYASSRERGADAQTSKEPLHSIFKPIYIWLNKKKDNKLLFPIFRALTRSPYPITAVNLYYKYDKDATGKATFDPLKNLEEFYKDETIIDKIELQQINKTKLQRPPPKEPITVLGGFVSYVEGQNKRFELSFTPNKNHTGEVSFDYRVDWQGEPNNQTFDTGRIFINQSQREEHPESHGQERPGNPIEEFQDLQDWLYKGFVQGIMDPSKYIAGYLLKIRVPLAIVGITGFLFQQTQVKDVLLAMVLDRGLQNEQHFVMATSMGVILSMLLWHTSRLLTRLFPQIEKIRRKESSISLERKGVFSNEMELLLFWCAWVSLALCTIPVAKEAYTYQEFGVWYGIWPLATLLITGGILIWLWRLLDRPTRSWTPPFEKRFGLLLVLGVLAGIAISAGINNAAMIPSFMGSIAMLFWGLSLILIVAFTLYQFSIITSFPLLSLLFAGLYLLNLNRINDNHQIRLLRHLPDKTEKSVKNEKEDWNHLQTNRHLPSLEQAFTSWLRQRKADILATAKEGRPYPIYVVSTQGGGIYAAYHSAKALAVLSDEVPGFSEHIFAISGVSGGSIGATIFANALSSEGQEGEGSKPPLLSKRIEDYFDKSPDRLAMIVSTMIFGDTTQRFFPIPVAAWDRSLGLELGFENPQQPGNNNKDSIRLDRSFYLTQDIRINPDYTLPQSSRLVNSTDKSLGPRAAPFLVLNTTEVKNGRRFLLAPFRIPPRINRIDAEGGGVPLTDADFHEPWVQKPEKMTAQDIRFSTAAALSARFPIISPYGFFPESKSRRLVDGGLYDNSGAITAYEIIETLKGIQMNYLSNKCANKIDLNNGTYRNPKQPREPDDPSELKDLLCKIKIYPIAIVDDKAVNLDSSYAELDNLAGQRKMQWLSWSAIEAVFSTRESRIQKAVDLLSRFDGDGTARRVLLRKEFRLAGEPRPTFTVPLGWKLSCQARAFINDQIQPLPKPNGQGLPWNADGATYTSLPCEKDFDLTFQRVPVRIQREAPPRGMAGKDEASMGNSLPHQASLSRPFWALIIKLKEDLGLTTAQTKDPSKP